MTEPSRAPRIVHLDDDLAVVDKPAGLVVHPAPSHQGPTLVSELAEILGGGDPERPGIVHRLDKGTSGLLVVARGDASHAPLQAQGQARQGERGYPALARGAPRRPPGGGGGRPRRSDRLSGARAGAHPPPQPGTTDAPRGRARQRHRMAVSGAASRQARTHFEVIEVLPRETYLQARL